MKKLKEIWKEYKVEILSAGAIIVGVGIVIFAGKKLSAMIENGTEVIAPTGGSGLNTVCDKLSAWNKRVDMMDINPKSEDMLWGVVQGKLSTDLVKPDWGDGIDIAQFWKEGDGVTNMIAAIKPERFADFAEKFASEVYTGANNNVIEVIVGG